MIVAELVKSGYSITSLPGACAVTTFLSQIPRDSEEFAFIGFIPRSEKQIEEVAKKLAVNNFVFYDSPERILKTLKVLMNIRGNVKIALGRELSKLFEEIKVGKISQILDHFKDGIKGEIVCMIYASENKDLNEIQAFCKLNKCELEINYEDNGEYDVYLDDVKSHSVLSQNDKKFVKYIFVSIVHSSFKYIIQYI